MLLEICSAASMNHLDNQWKMSAINHNETLGEGGNGDVLLFVGRKVKKLTLDQTGYD